MPRERLTIVLAIAYAFLAGALLRDVFVSPAAAGDATVLQRADLDRIVRALEISAQASKDNVRALEANTQATKDVAREVRDGGRACSK